MASLEKERAARPFSVARCDKGELRTDVYDHAAGVRGVEQASLPGDDRAVCMVLRREYWGAVLPQGAVI